MNGARPAGTGLIPAFDLQLFGEGRHWHAYRWLGARQVETGGIPGTLFAVWAPNAASVRVIGDFNRWNGASHPLRRREGGIWGCFIPGLGAGALYKYEIHTGTGEVLHKADPYGRQFELRPATASVVEAPSRHTWTDAGWMGARRESDWSRKPLSIYEVHPGSWARRADGSWLGYRELAQQLVEYVLQQGYTHIELLPVMEHPFDGSWGYQCIGNFAPTRRYGEPDDFRWFVNHCHDRGVGVILDWVPAHFPRDEHGLARFDGTALYEHADPRLGEHPDWGTLIYNYGRLEVKNYLLSSALYWLEEFHVDGLRVDAVASMLYLDYSRPAEAWLPNAEGGNTNLEAIAFLRELNTVVHGQYPGTLTIAEESTAWPLVSRPVHLGGLGFSMKWNMGWMHDSLDYLRHDPLYRGYHHAHLTFGITYAQHENFVLALSHDEVVHGKSPLIHKMPGDEWRRFANLRLLYCYQWTYPGKKLLFMGGEFGQTREWDHDKELDWGLLQYPMHAGLQRLVADLNHLYRHEPALYRGDFEAHGFEWIDCHDWTQSAVSYLRRSGEEELVVVLNFTPVPRHGYLIGVSRPGRYRELLNSDSRHYGGSDLGNAGALDSETRPWMGRPHSLGLTLPPLAALILQWTPGAAEPAHPGMEPRPDDRG